ncbi:MAG TPA: NAD(P)H-dependent oxidoreductase [Candidatus Paceibacterota bacterium]|nr:NAD(P)H-dependent oxidoreductase [Candidatus Paceibacterota bacterium]
MAKIFILQGNPDNESFCGSFATAYEEGAKSAGHEVRRMNIGEMQFDPILHKGYKVIQALEPDLLQVQEEMKWADHIVILYPMWWSSMPALLKGMFDRMFLPGFAYHFNKDNMGWHGLLHGKSAHVFITMDSWPMIQRILFGDSTNEIGRAILRFSGIHPVRIKKIGPMKDMSAEHIETWKQKIYQLGQNAK